MASNPPSNTNSQAIKVDDRLLSSFRSYSSLASSQDNMQLAVGRSSSMEGSEEDIFQDAFEKLSVNNGHKILCIGIGCGQIANWWLLKAIEMDLSLCFVDFPEVLNKIKRALIPKFQTLPELRLVKGIFPHECVDEIANEKYDAIEMYSVIHCSDAPLKLIEAAASFLAPGGRLLIGDIPNLDRKGRFLSTVKGRKFDANYKNIPLENAPVFKDYHSFTKTALADGAPHIDDTFIYDLIKLYRSKGFDVFLLNQPLTLPFSFTREDILIIAPHD